MKKINIILVSLLIIFLSFSTVYTCFATSTVAEEEDLSKNNYLKSLSVEGYEISPEFNKNTSTYYLAVPMDITEVVVLTETEAPNAKIKITGNTSLTKTENTIKIVVTSEKGKTKTYNIIVNKQKDNGVKLTSLSIKGAELSPEFESSKYYYNAQLKSDKDFTDVDVEAVSNVDGASIEVLGNKSLEVGDNLITIIVSSGSNTTVYQVLVDVTVEKIVVTETKQEGNFLVNLWNSIKNFFSNKEKTIAFLAVIAFMLLIMIICVIIKIIKNNRINKNKERLRNRAK